MLTDEFMLRIARLVAHWFELGGIAVIICGTLLAFVQMGLIVRKSGLFRSNEDELSPIASFRRTLGRSILTGLELLVAADIILTVAVEPTPERVVVLGAIVLIRTFLSFSLEVEIDGRWPWQKDRPG
jgi:uncharacterized membrane protein